MIDRLENHPMPFVKLSELALYWGVSYKLLHKQIQAGTLPALKLGRLLRVSVKEAMRFEEDAKMTRETLQ
jgi:hypothetical protein